MITLDTMPVVIKNITPEQVNLISQGVVAGVDDDLTVLQIVHFLRYLLDVIQAGYRPVNSVPRSPNLDSATLTIQAIN